MIRSEIKRKAPAAEPKPAKGPRTVKCKVRGCLHRFVPNPKEPQVKWCSIECGTALALATLGAKKLKMAKADRAATKAKLKTRGEWVREAQAAFNSLVRMRDKLAGYPCISSGRPLDWSGNAVDAGHYRSVGSAPHLRFNEDNVHAQSKHDNQYKSGNAVDYRLGLIARIGLERVEALESDQTPRHYSIDDLKTIKAHYQAKLKVLKAAEP